MSYKTRVAGGPRIDKYAGRFWHNFNVYRVGQITTGNMKQMLTSTIGQSTSSPVVSDIQPFCIHNFKNELESSVVLIVRNASEHNQNITDISKASMMVGHTDPQIFHWFKQLGSIPPRSLISGKAEKLSGHTFDDVWWNTVVRHPVIHDQAKEMWENDEGVGQADREKMKARELERDQKRMARMTGCDWRAKHKERERSPSPEEDEETPLYVMNAEDFSLYRMHPETLYYADSGVAMHRVTTVFPEPRDPLARCAPRFIRMANLNRQKFIASVNFNYALKLSNAFAFDVTKKGMYLMGTPETEGSGKEEWNEYYLEFGKNMEITTEVDLDWWFRGLMRFGQSETNTTNSDIDEANPADYQFRGT
eukprot:PhM_4_TR14843/c0_g1_i1/m.63787